MSRTKKILLALLIVFVCIQFIQPARNQSVQASPTDITTVYSIPGNVQSILKNSCYDCHSNNTRYPWYTRIQPVGWFMRSHITEGKAELNFNEFASYSPRKQSNKLREIAGSIKDNWMPINSYLWMHHDAKLSKEEKALLVDWVTKTRDSISAKNQKE